MDRTDPFTDDMLTGWVQILVKRNRLFKLHTFEIIAPCGQLKRISKDRHCPTRIVHQPVIINNDEIMRRIPEIGFVEGTSADNPGTGKERIGQPDTGTPDATVIDDDRSLAFRSGHLSE